MSSAPVPVPPRRLVDVARDHAEISGFLQDAEEGASREFYGSLLQGLMAEAQQLIRRVRDGQGEERDSEATNSESNEDGATED